MGHNILFFGREAELQVLDEQYASPKATFQIIYGRRRVGKTHLLTHWLQTREVPGFYWQATQTTSEALLGSFTGAVLKYMTGRLGENVKFFTWEDAFEALILEVEKRPAKTVVILDEFTYALNSDPSLASILQQIWDHRLKNLPVFLIISGSHVGMMQRSFMSDTAPLFGRATGAMQLLELPFKNLIDFFPNYTVEERVAMYSIVGGIPYYLEQFDSQLSVSENIVKKVITFNNFMQEEPRLILHEQFQEPRMYLGVLQAIAQGKNVMSDIALEINEDRSQVSRYIATLVNLGLLRHEHPVTLRRPEQSRKGRYAIQDQYLRFYFRFIQPRLSDIAMRMDADVLAYIREHMISYVGTYGFEPLCRLWVQIAGATRQLPFHPEQVGSHWSKTEQIDVAAINWRSHDVLFGECKWGKSKPLDVDVVNRLVQQSHAAVSVDPNKKPFQVHYAYFSRAGFTPEAEARIKQMGALAVDLNRFEEVLNLAVR